MKKNKLILRIIVSPFIFGLLTVSYTYGLFKHFVLYIRWGGEWITYAKDDTKRIKDIFDSLKMIHKEIDNENNN